MPAIPLIGYAPDADPATPGILRSGAFVATSRGIKGPPDFVSLPSIPAGGVGPDVYSATPFRSVYVAGTADRLYVLDLTSLTWADRSRAAGYTPSIDRWSFSAFGDQLIAARAGAALQTYTVATGIFDNLSTTAPVARLVACTANFALAFDIITDTTGGGLIGEDRWWCSPISNPAGNWTPSLSTQATSGRLIGGTGPILAALPLGDQMVVYKTDAVFVGSYVGSPEVWRWTQVPGRMGVSGFAAVCDIGGAHFFVGTEGPSLFDGTRPVAVGDGVARLTLSGLTGPFLQTASCWYDRSARIVYFTTAAGDGVCYTYALATQRFGLFPMGAGGELDGNGVIGPARIVPTIDAGAGSANDRTREVFGVLRNVSGTRRVQRASGTSAISFTTHTFGEPSRESYASAFRVIKTGSAGVGTVTGSVGRTQQTIAPTGAGSSTAGDSAVDAAFDIRQTGRWHAFTASFPTPGTTDFTAVELDARPVGGR